jgi:hypothetical protein
METICFVKNLTTNKKHTALTKILEVLFLFKQFEFLKLEINFSVFLGVDVTLQYNHSSKNIFFSNLFLVFKLLINPTNLQ